MKQVVWALLLAAAATLAVFGIVRYRAAQPTHVTIVEQPRANCSDCDCYEPKAQTNKMEPINNKQLGVYAP